MPGRQGHCLCEDLLLRNRLMSYIIIIWHNNKIAPFCPRKSQLSESGSQKCSQTQAEVILLCWTTEQYASVIILACYDLMHKKSLCFRSLKKDQRSEFAPEGYSLFNYSGEWSYSTLPQNQSTKEETNIYTLGFLFHVSHGVAKTIHPSRQKCIHIKNPYKTVYTWSRMMKCKQKHTVSQ